MNMDVNKAGFKTVLKKLLCECFKRKETRWKHLLELKDAFKDTFKKTTEGAFKEVEIEAAHAEISCHLIPTSSHSQKNIPIMQLEMTFAKRPLSDIHPHFQVSSPRFALFFPSSSDFKKLLWSHRRHYTTVSQAV